MSNYVNDMTNEEIWDFLKNKMEKNGLTSKASIINTHVDDYPNNEVEIIKAYYEPDVHNAIALAYKVGYLRSQKGRPFKIGEKKKCGHWEWIKPNEIVPDGTKVRYTKREENDDSNDPYCPKIGQECIKLNTPGWPDADFWVQFEGSNYKFIYKNFHQNCFQKWVEDDE